jgi:hypothetical protein
VRSGVSRKVTFSEGLVPFGCQVANGCAFYFFLIILFSFPHFLFLVILGNVRLLTAWQTTNDGSAPSLVTVLPLPTILSYYFIRSGPVLSICAHGVFSFLVLDGTMHVQDL